MRRPHSAATANARAATTAAIALAALTATHAAGAAEPAPTPPAAVAPTPTPAPTPTRAPAPTPPRAPLRPTRADIEARLMKAPAGPSPSEQGDIARDAPGVLVQIAGDRAARLPLRARAMSALAYARTPGAHDFLENFVIRYMPAEGAAERQLLRKAAIALGWQAGGRTVEILGLLLDHGDPEVRIDAAVALGLTRTRAAEKPLRSRLDRETDPGVRAQIEGQLKALVPEASKTR